ncbi:MAG: di-trans,poly-cis-decaprenylcistransferase [Proteobacteria bacterium]|nr:di-trans,poly-cis-decaprenylcistransferase [Burkholderiales bacterium]
MFRHHDSPEAVGSAGIVPRHVAIIMDGNGRWARQRLLPRIAGHRKGANAVRATVQACGEAGIEYLTLFAFSSENWRRPADEVSALMELFATAIEQEVSRLHEHGVRFRVAGDRARFEPRLQALIEDAEATTAGNRRMTLTVAANYGGRWDITQAVNRVLAERDRRGTPGGPVDESEIAAHLSLAHAPEPDLFIRTGGETRISNFLLWQLAYTELWFTETLWPDFGASDIQAAVEVFRSRERRFGRTSEQVQDAPPSTTGAAYGHAGHGRTHAQDTGELLARRPAETASKVVGAR